MSGRVASLTGTRVGDNLTTRSLVDQGYPRVGDVVFTDRELDVMGVLWEHGPSTVADVRGRLADRLAYTTVLTILRTLEEKGVSSVPRVAFDREIRP